MPFVTCNSGTDALVLGLRALGLGRGDEIITPAFTFFATLEAIYHVGATPVFADIDRSTYNIDPSDIEKRITKRTKAVLLVHLFGLSCDMDAIGKICKKHDLLLIEDAAQSFGAKHHGRLAGTFGNLGCFSFFPTKNLGGFGDGGGVTVRDRSVELLFRKLKNHGGASKYNNEEMGYNSRLDAMQAGLLLERFRSFKREMRQRQRSARRWINTLENDPQVLQLPVQKGHTYNQFSLLVRDRDAFIRQLDKKKIPHMIYYAKPLYQQRAYTKAYGKHRPLPNTEFVAKHIISLPLLY
jgi:dTDP-4-amino-4,6-dideoxygalactose transaminase